MSTRLLAVLLLVFAPRAWAGPVEDWHAGPDARLIVVLVDGLSRDFLFGTDLDGEALMPATLDWTGAAVEFTEVLASETHARRAREQLRAGLEAFGATTVEWVRAGEADPGQAIGQFDGRSGRQVLVLDLDWLEPPLEFDDDTLRRLDPAPWADEDTDPPIEAIESKRRARARRLAPLKARPNPRNAALTRDLHWILGTAHATVDRELASVLARATGTGASVLLTATSSSGVGQRDAVGPGIGAGLDVAKVPVFWLVPGQEPAVDPAPRQWIGLDPTWFATGTDADRYTWASPAEGSSGRTAICELRWTTGRFTLLDTSSPAQPPRLYDRLLDPGEWYDRAVEFPALADSLRSELRTSLYGASPVIVFRAGDEPVDLVLSIPQAGRQGAGQSPVYLAAGETTRVRLPFGAETIRLGARHQVRIGGEEFLLDELVVHSPAWRALAGEPDPGPKFTIWME